MAKTKKKSTKKAAKKATTAKPAASKTPATSKKTAKVKTAKPAKPEPEFPNRKEDDQALKAGLDVLRARYRRDVKAAAKSILEEIASDNDGQHPGNRQLQEEIEERLDSAADSAVTYNSDQYEIIYVSNNLDAVDDVGSGLGLSSDGAITAIAYWAYHADLREELERLDIDEFFPNSESADEDEDDED